MREPTEPLASEVQVGSFAFWEDDSVVPTRVYMLLNIDGKIYKTEMFSSADPPPEP